MDVSPETLRVTALGRLTPGRPVNLERRASKYRRAQALSAKDLIARTDLETAKMTVDTKPSTHIVELVRSLADPGASGAWRR